MNHKILWILLFMAVLYQAPIWAMKSDVKMVQPKAFFVKSEHGLYEALDKVQKTVSFTPTDFEKCAQSMMRQQNSLFYYCTLEIPSTGAMTRLQEQLSAKQAVVRFGGTDKKVRIQVSNNARRVTFSTQFDDTGVDFEVTNFNNEFFKVYSKVAQLVIAEAMDREPLKIQVLEAKD